jgi:hypothetical protein
VVRHLAAALGADELDPAPCKLLGRGQHVLLVGRPAQRQDRLVLEQQQLIGDLVSAARSHKLVLLLPRLAIEDAAQPMDL